MSALRRFMRSHTKPTRRKPRGVSQCRHTKGQLYAQHPWTEETGADVKARMDVARLEDCDARLAKAVERRAELGIFGFGPQSIVLAMIRPTPPKPLNPKEYVRHKIAGSIHRLEPKPWSNKAEMKAHKRARMMENFPV